MNKEQRLASVQEFADSINSGLSAPKAYNTVRGSLDEEFSEASVRRAAAIVKGQPHAHCMDSEGPTDPTRKGGALKTQRHHKADGSVAASTSPIRLLTRDRIKTLDDLLDVTKVDREIYDVRDYRVNTWETKAKEDEKPITLFQVRANLIPKPLEHRYDLQREALIEIAKKGAPKYKKRKRSKVKEPHLFELSPADLHVGKYAWAGETGEDYDCDIAADRLNEAVEVLAERAEMFGVDRCLYVMGNDLLQVDNEKNQTTRGTDVDTDTRYKRVFRRACELQIMAVNRLLELGPVDVVVVPGNHDELAAFHAGEYLAAHFRLNSDVRVDNEPPLRKYYRYGRNLLGFTHGNNEKPAALPMIMASERPQDWSETISREFHCGHLHKRKATHYVPTDTIEGVTVRILPSLSATDRWHHVKGYVGGMKACEGYLHHRYDGYAGHFSHNVHKVREVAWCHWD